MGRIGKKLSDFNFLYSFSMKNKIGLFFVKKVAQMPWKPENINYVWPTGGLSSTCPLISSA
jgi:hypothetical protein